MKKVSMSVKLQARRQRALARFSITPPPVNPDAATKTAYNAYLDRKNVELAALKQRLGV